MSKQMLHTYIESSFLSSSSLVSGFVDVLLFSGDGLNEYCVDRGGSAAAVSPAVVDDDEFIVSVKVGECNHVNELCECKK